MPARKSSIGITIDDPDIEALGPAMLACTPLMRRFVIGIINNRFKDASRVYRVAGGSKNDNTSRKGAYQLLRHPKIIRAIQEESGRRLEGLTAIAMFALERNVNSKNGKVSQSAIDSILDRTGFPRRTERSLDVTDTRQEHNYEQLLTMVSEKLRVLAGKPPAVPAIEAPYKEIEHVEQATPTSRPADEQPRTRKKARAS